MLRPAATYLILCLATTLCASLSAQDFKWFEAENIGAKFKIYKRLVATPLEAGSEIDLRNRFRPDKALMNPKGGGSFTWYFKVYEFFPAKRGRQPKKTPRQAQIDKLRAYSYEHFITEKDRGAGPSRVFVTKKRKTRAKGKRPAYEYWEYYNKGEGRDGQTQIWWSWAAAYDLGDRSIALEATFPVLDMKNEKPEKKHAAWAMGMIATLNPMKVKAGSGSSSGNRAKDSWAKTATQKAALEDARKGIAGMATWDYFTSPHVIILYDWPKGKQKKAETYAKQVAASINAAWEKFEELFPAPKGLEIPYGTIRVCHSWGEYQKYDHAKEKQYAHYIPGANQIVTFNDTKRIFGGAAQLRALTIAQAWSMYADACFRRMKQPYWFVEGVGIYLSGYSQRGKKWSYKPYKPYQKIVSKLMSKGKARKFSNMLELTEAKVEAEQRDDLIAQAYAVADFLFRGHNSLGKAWNPAWTGSIERYRDNAVKSRSSKRAAKAAFPDFDQKALQEAYETWVQKHMKK